MARSGLRNLLECTRRIFRVDSQLVVPGGLSVKRMAIIRFYLRERELSLHHQRRETAGRICMATCAPVSFNNASSQSGFSGEFS